VLGADSATSVHVGQRVSVDLAVLVLDIRDFTTMSELMTPEETFDWLVNFSSLMSPIVRRFSGFIDKFIGDEIMAIFQSADDALLCAQMMQKAVRHFNEHFQTLARKHRLIHPITVRVGIGVHFGAVVAGVIGDPLRYHGTVLSDAVTLASRLEELCKYYGVTIIASEALLNRCKTDAPRHRLLGSAAVKGRTLPVTVYDIFEADDNESFDYKLKTTKEFEQAGLAFQQGSFDLCKLLCLAILEKYPHDPVKHPASADAVFRLAKAAEAKEMQAEDTLPQPWRGTDSF